MSFKETIIVLSVLVLCLLTLKHLLAFVLKHLWGIKIYLKHRRAGMWFFYTRPSKTGENSGSHEISNNCSTLTQTCLLYTRALENQAGYCWLLLKAASRGFIPPEWVDPRVSLCQLLGPQEGFIFLASWLTKHVFTHGNICLHFAHMVYCFFIQRCFPLLWKHLRKHQSC